MDEKIDIKKLRIPTHIAIILDGNGTWAKNHGYPRNIGHRKGARNLIDIVRYAAKIKVPYLTVFAFSTENWSRPKKEVDYLMRLLEVFLKEQKVNIKKNNTQLKIIGSTDRLTEKQRQIIAECHEESKDCTGIHVNIAFNYGSYEEITQAVKEIAADVSNGKIRINDITPELINSHLYTKNIPPVDLLVRTSGQQRISNFMLWQIAYSELYFPKTLWPDFTPDEFDKAIYEYNKRDRKFGGLKCEQE